ncbi:MAG: 50S ribosomal protein L7/L12 [Planctomycetes bacterium]|nr:50S ribosomal protein L7/L12 [Planctomycetota bacterium]
MAEAAVATDKKAYSGKVQGVIDTLKQFTLMDLKELKEAYEETFGVKAAAGIPMGMMPMAGGAGGGGGAEPAKAVEPTIFTVVLKEIGDKKIQVIKVVRELTGLGLKEAKDLVDSALQGPAKVKENLPKAEAEAAQKKLEEVGAVIGLNPA